MKSLIAFVIALSSVSAFAKTEVMCGRVEISNSSGMLTVVTYYLNVPSGPFSPGFMPVQIQASGTDIQAINTASAIIRELKNGDQVCLEGEVFETENFDVVIVPAKRVK